MLFGTNAVKYSHSWFFHITPVFQINTRRALKATANTERRHALRSLRKTRWLFIKSVCCQAVVVLWCTSHTPYHMTASLVVWANTRAVVLKFQISLCGLTLMSSKSQQNDALPIGGCVAIIMHLVFFWGGHALYGQTDDRKLVRKERPLCFVTAPAAYNRRDRPASESVVRCLITDTAQGHASVLLSVVSSAIHLHNHEVWGPPQLCVLQALLPLERLEGSTQQM